jgi:hypothetical protein
MKLATAISIVALAFPALGQDLRALFVVTNGNVVIDRLYPNPYAGR